MIKYILYSAILISGGMACSSQPNVDQQQGPIATRVYSKILYENEVVNEIPLDISKIDSVNIRNNYINFWVERQLLLHRAELNLSTEDQDVSSKLEDYKNDLLIYTYQNRLLEEKLDTNVSDIEIEKYYIENKDNFALADYILKAQYLKLDSTDKNIDKVKNWLLSNNEQNFNKLYDYCHMHSIKYSFSDEWMYLYEFMKEIPAMLLTKRNLLNQKRVIEFYDNGYYYLIRIMDYKLKNSVSPLALEKENIKRIILNDRKLDFLDKLSVDIYNDAKNKKEIEIYTH